MACSLDLSDRWQARCSCNSPNPNQDLLDTALTVAPLDGGTGVKCNPSRPTVRVVFNQAAVPCRTKCW